MQTNRRPETHSEEDMEPPLKNERANVRPPSVTYVGARSSRKRLVLLVSFLCIGVASGGIILFSAVKKTAPAETAAVVLHPVLTVTAEPAQRRSIHQEVKVTGSVWARDPLSIASEDTGLRIESVLVDEGYQVKKGQTLAVLNSSILKAELEREKAQLASSEAALNKSFQPNRREDINGLRAVVAQTKANLSQQRSVKVQAEANLQNARSNAKRYTDLLTQGAVSAQEAESRETISRVAEAELRSSDEKIRAADFVLRQAEERLGLAEAGGRTEDVQIAHADVDRSRANVHRLEALLAQTIIKAPSDGLIIRRDAHIGDTPAVGKSLFQMIRDNQIELRAQVPEKDLSLLRPGLQVNILSPALQQKSVQGRVREIGSQVDPDTRLCTVKIDVDSHTGLKPGMFAEGRVSMENFQALTVPSRSMISKDNRYLVFVFEENHPATGSTLASGVARLRYIQPGARSGDLIETSQGLKAGEQVITGGAGFLKDGDVVEVGK